MRAILFVDGHDLRRSLRFDLTLMGFDVIVPRTREETARTLRPSPGADLLVLSWSKDGATSIDLLNAASRPGPAMPVILIAETRDVPIIYNRVRVDGIIVLPTEASNFTSAVHCVCGIPDHARFHETGERGPIG